MAALCAGHRDRFPAFVAAVCLSNVEAAIVEARRAITQLGAAGVQIYTNVAGHPLDEARFEPFFAAMAELDRPIWLHPTRTADMTDYPAEKKSRYEMWWCFGWPYDTSVAMTRLVFSGLFDRHPGLKIITHHLGGMIPYYDGRVGPGLEVLGSRTSDEDYSTVLPSLEKPHMDYFRSFYADTAMFGAHGGLRCGIDFFGVDHVVFRDGCTARPDREDDRRPAISRSRSRRLSQDRERQRHPSAQSVCLRGSSMSALPAAKIDIDAELAAATAGIGSLGRSLSPDVLAASQALYAPFHESEPYAGIVLTRDHPVWPRHPQPGSMFSRATIVPETARCFFTSTGRLSTRRQENRRAALFRQYRAVGGSAGLGRRQYDVSTGANASMAGRP